MPFDLKGDIKIPVVGDLPKPVVFGGLAVTGYLIYRARTKSAAAPTAGQANADPYPSDGTIGNPGDPNSVDPQTGVTYGDEAVGYTGNQTGVPDSGQLQSMGGDAFPWDGTYGNPNDPYSMDTSTGLTYGQEGSTGGGESSGTPGSNGPPFSTNQEWAAYAEQQLASDTSINQAKLAEVLGLYLAGQPVDTSEEDLIYAAQGVAGMPPVAGTNAMPPGINVKGSKGGGGTGKATNPVTGLKVTQPGDTGVDIGWTAATGATSYTVTSSKGTVELTGATSARIHDINKPGDHGDQATVKVQANPYKTGQQIAKIVVHTTTPSKAKK